MFRPSQSLLFRPMPILNKLKLHHPLPLNARESKQLLNLLTTSFRQQLDSEHPQFRLDSSKNPDTPHEQARRPRRHSFSGHEKTPTDRHMHSLLSNPLFNPFAEGGGARAALSRNPMDIFDQAVSKGMMTTGYAEACLVARKAQITRSSILDIREGMKDSGAGLKVLKWLVSSGTANNIDFLKNVSFSTILMQYMVAENLQEVAWKWIKKSLEGAPKLLVLSGAEYTQARRETVEPLMLLIRAEAFNQAGLDAAYIALSRAAGYLQGMSAVGMIQVLGPPGRYLLRKSLVQHSARPSPGEASFESFLSLIPVITKRSERYFAHLSLLHPTKPSPDLALAYIQNIQDSPKVASQRIPGDDSEHHIIQLGLETAKVLLEQHRYSEADDVMDFLRVNYADQLGIKERREMEQAKAEASSLEILAGLGLT